MVDVVAALVWRGDRFMICQRPAGKKRGLLWEFPGGKLEPGESAREALVREIREELDVDIRVGRLLETVEYDYPEFHLTMHCFICELLSEEIVLKEHEDARWLKKEELDSVGWLPADVGVISKIFELK